jgi:hypothetical protein
MMGQAGWVLFGDIDLGLSPIDDFVTLFQLEDSMIQITFPRSNDLWF